MNAKYYKAIRFLRQCAVMKRRFTLPITLVKTKFWKSESYFPELPNHKSRFRIFCELMGHIWKYGSIEWYYFAYGFDVIDFRDKREYMDESQFIWNIYMLDAVMPSYDYTCILRDKTLFSTLLPMYGVKCPRIVLDTRDGDVQHTVNQLFAEFSGGGYFSKPVDGQCGAGVFKFLIKENVCVIDEKEYALEDGKRMVLHRLNQGSYIVQEFVQQSDIMQEIYPHSVNTLRLTTVVNKLTGKVEPFAAFFRVGVNGMTMDNWAAGGILCPMDVKTGKLKKYGWYKHGCGTKVLKHPNTGFVFDDFQFPHYTEALNQAMYLHAQLKEIPIIGWDIAMTTDGPLFIEGNDNIEVGPMQTIYEKGMKTDFKQLFTRI